MAALAKRFLKLPFSFFIPTPDRSETEATSERRRGGESALKGIEKKWGKEIPTFISLLFLFFLSRQRLRTEQTSESSLPSSPLDSFGGLVGFCLVCWVRRWGCSDLGGVKGREGEGGREGPFFFSELCSAQSAFAAACKGSRRVVLL